MYISNFQTTIKMHEYDLKIAISDGLRNLLSENNSMGLTFERLDDHLLNLQSRFIRNPELKVMNRYMFEMARCRKLFQNQLDGLVGAFNRFIIHVKRNSLMEKIFAQTDDEEERSVETSQESSKSLEDDSTRSTPYEGQSIKSAPCENHINVKIKLATPTKERKKRIRKSNKKTHGVVQA